MDPVTRWEETVNKTVRTAARNMPQQDREDIKQECWLNICQMSESIDRIDLRSPEEATRYVIQICRNVIADITKSAIRESEVLDANFGDVKQSDREQKQSNPFGVSTEELRNALDHLTANQRFVIDCLFFRRMTEAETGAEVSRGQPWVSKTRDKAIKELRGLLNAGKD